MSVAELFVNRDTTVQDALRKLDAGGRGVVLLAASDGALERTVTDGDLRRLILSGAGLDATLAQLEPRDSIVLRRGFTRTGALELMNQHSINHLPVLDEAGRVLRLVDRKEIDEQILLSTPHLGDMERAYVEEAFRTNWIAPLGPNVDAFERELAELVGVGHAAAVSSGTAAIHLALLLLGVGRGDTVFCSALTFAASVNPVVYQGAEPVFIDSEPDSWNMSPAALERALADAAQAGKLPRAVIVVNLYGQSADMDPLCAACERYGVPVVEDAAESLGATYKGAQSGTFGRLGIYSFNGNKIITTSGGGMLVSDDAELIARARFLATQAREPVAHYEHKVVGYNYRMSNILAGVGRGQLQVLPERIRARRAVFDRYRDGLKQVDGLQWMPEPAWSVGNRWLSVALIDAQAAGIDAQELVRRLAAERIEARPVWKPMQLQPVFQACRYYAHSGAGSVSESLFANGICLPSGSNMGLEQQGRVIETIAQLLPHKVV